MTREETKTIIKAICTGYPNYKPRSIQDTVDLWTALFAEKSYAQVSSALHSYMMSDLKGFPPSPGQLNALIVEQVIPDGISEIEAWSLVSRAIRNSGYNSEEEFAKLPVTVRKVLGSPSQLRTWALDENYNESVVSSQFMRNYRTQAEREERRSRLPIDARMMIEKLNPVPERLAVEQKVVMLEEIDPPVTFTDEVEEKLANLKREMGRSEADD